MVAVLCRLKLSLMRGGFKRNIWQLVGLILGGLYGLGLAGLAAAGLVALRFVETQLAGEVLVVAFGVVVLAWLVLPLLVFGTDQTLDPARFALFPVTGRSLRPGLFVSAFISIPAALTLLLMIVAVVPWTRTPLTTLAAVVAAALSVSTCVLLSRVVTTAFSRLLSSRRSRDITTIVAVVAFSLIGVVFLGVGRGAEALRADGLQDALSIASTVLGWSPFGWAWAVPADVAAGSWATAAIRLLLAVALPALLWLAWAPLLDQSLASPVESGGDGGEVSGAGWVDRIFPATPAGAVAGRALRYWRRDPRYLSGLASLVITPVILMVMPLLIDGMPPQIALVGPAAAGLTAGLTAAYDLAYDGKAVWLHVATGIAGRADRLGRVMAGGAVLLPILLLGSIGAGLVAGRVDFGLLAFAGGLGAGLISHGVACVTGARWQPPVPGPGENPFASKGFSASAWVALIAHSGATGVLILAPLVLAVIGFATTTPALIWTAAGLAIALGVAAVIIGVRWGGRILDRRWPEVLHAATIS